MPTDVNPSSAPATVPSADGCLKRWAKQIGPAGPLAAVMVALPVVGGAVLLGFIRQLAPWLKSHASAGTFALLVAAYAALAGFALVPTYVLEIVAGWVFGPTVGLVAALAGLTAAATVSYGLARAIVGDHVEHAAHENARCEAVRKSMVGSGPVRAALIVALLRLAPVVPFGATNLLMASVGCRLAPFVAGTALGTLPRTAAIVFVASEMSELEFKRHPDLFAAGLVATVFVVAVLGYLAKKALAQVTEAAGQEATQE